MSEGRQTVAGAYEKIEGHEKICAIRYESINDQLGSLFGWVKWGVGGIVGVMFLLACGFGVELYKVQVAKLQPGNSQTVVMQQPAAAPAPAANAERTPAR